mmetsp:Transcript_35695/g.70230  ORF Transcript_35695/g.70230 Transcript_35695/m.70230 type:complete len:84 (-) Transcript_35695:315-566(-)
MFVNHCYTFMVKFIASSLSLSLLARFKYEKMKNVVVNKSKKVRGTGLFTRLRLPKKVFTLWAVMSSIFAIPYNKWDPANWPKN